MKRSMCVLVSAGLMAAMVQVSLRADEQKTPSIKQVMRKLHGGQNSELRQVRKDLMANPPEWDKVKKLTKDFVILGASLAKNEPPRGEKDSWTKLANEYFENAKAMDDAAQKEDKDAALAAQKKLATSCKSCHDLHRGH